MIRNRTTLRLVAASLAVLATGCAPQTKKPTPQQSANVQWNGARSTVMISLAKDQYDAGQLDKARQTINQAMKLSPESANARILSAKIAIEQQQLEVAEKELRLAREFDPKNAEADYLGGVVYQRWQKPDLAYECYSHASDKAPTELAYLLARAEMLVAMERGPEALKLLLDRVVYFEHSSAIRDAVGQLLIQQKKFPEAVAMIREATVLTPDDMTVREHLGMAMFYAGQYDQAILVLSRLVTQEKFAGRPELHAALGECYDQTGQFREGRASFEQATKLDPSSAGLWLGLGKAAMQLDDYRRAELSLKKAMAIDPSSTEANLLLGYLRFRQNRLPEALVAFKQVSNAPDADPVSLCMTGLVLQKLGHADDAVQYYAKALKRNPNDELAHHLMAGLDTRE